MKSARDALKLSREVLERFGLLGENPISQVFVQIRHSDPEVQEDDRALDIVEKRAGALEVILQCAAENLSGDEWNRLVQLVQEGDKDVAFALLASKLQPS